MLWKQIKRYATCLEAIKTTIQKKRHANTAIFPWMKICIKSCSSGKWQGFLLLVNHGGPFAGITTGVSHRKTRHTKFKVNLCLPPSPLLMEITFDGNFITKATDLGHHVAPMVLAPDTVTTTTEVCA